MNNAVKRASAGWLVVLAWHAAGLSLAHAAVKQTDQPIQPILERLCVGCHGEALAEGRLNIEEMTQSPDFGPRFKDWERVIRVLREGKMPPKKKPQPSTAERQLITQTVEQGLNRYIQDHAGEPGRVPMRRLTSAEYAYTIKDLTGLDLKAADGFVSDAVSGTGFTNAGAAQFMQDSTLERYLEAARIVADHAVIGAGPLDFFADPGQTGRELSAITRIQRIYREYGFRTAAGEGAEPFGLDLYPRAMFVAWQYRFRSDLGLGNVTLVELARREGLSVRLADHVWNVLGRTDTRFPLAMIISRWQSLPAPATLSARDARARCNELGNTLREWQSTLAATSGDEEEAAVLTAGDIVVAPSHVMKADIDWAKGARNAEVELSVSTASEHSAAGAVVAWRNPLLRFLTENGKPRTPRPLRDFVSPESAKRLSFSAHPPGISIGDSDFAIKSGTVVPVSIQVPEGATAAQLLVDVELIEGRTPSNIVRCRISDGDVPGETAAETGETSTLLANPAGPLVARWKEGVAEFAHLLPEVSQREPAPSDRDPIPPPFDNAYNKPERNHFHATIKYHRDDDFFVAHVADDATRRRLDQAWTDLLTSFEYHDANLRFLSKKYSLLLDKASITDLDDTKIDRLPEAARTFARRWKEEYSAMRSALAAAEPGHLEDALRFAEEAWRRPLSPDEQQRLRQFYTGLRVRDKMEHPKAIRTLLARILVSPAFLYRLEPSAQRKGVSPISVWQLASRLSYLVWSSEPDEPLKQAATAGRLHDSQVLEQEARRMLRDPKARRLATEFFGQWLGFYRFDHFQGIDSKRFPEFTDRLRSALYDEAVSFFEYIVRENRPIDEILFADYSFWNRRLAEHYGKPNSSAATDKLTRVEHLEAEHRGGLLGLGVVMAVTSAPLRTSAVKRGEWILRRVVGTPVPPPPPDVGSLPADDVAADKLSVRQRLEAHRSNASCVNCHARMDPLGFALEHYDPIGRWRDTYRDGARIDSSGTLGDGTVITGPDGLRDYLRREKASFHRTLCSRLLVYALGRPELITDRPLIEKMMSDIDQGRRFADIVVRIVASPQFQKQRAESPDDASESPRGE